MKLSILIIALVTSLVFTANAQVTKPVVSDQVAHLQKAETKLVILDVRTPMEFDQGHLKGALNYNINDPDVMERINKLDKNTPYLVYCRTKNRSGVIVKAMEQSGFTILYQMTDGIVGWNANKLPLEK